VPITVTGAAGHQVVVQAMVDNPGPSARHDSGFVESNGYVSIDVDHFTRIAPAHAISPSRRRP